MVVARDALRVHPFSIRTWDAQSSGTVIKPAAEGALEKRWAELTGRRPMPAPVVAAMQAWHDSVRDTAPQLAPPARKRRQ